MLLQWLITAALVALCFYYVIKALLPKRSHAQAGQGCSGCSQGCANTGRDDKPCAAPTVHGHEAQVCDARTKDGA